MNINLTEKQKKVLEMIYETIKSSGFPPSFADLRDELGVQSNQSVANFLTTLEKKGYIKREEGQARGIKILPLGYKALEEDPLIPFGGVSAAGSFVLSLEETTIKWETLPGKVHDEIIKQSEDQIFLIQVQGDSMVNAGILNGDTLLIKQAKNFITGDIVVARNDDGTTVKRFIAEPNGRVYLAPENPAYKNIPIYEDTYFDGKVVANLSALQRLYGQQTK